jgi:hypothetical protein
MGSAPAGQPLRPGVTLASAIDALAEDGDDWTPDAGPLAAPVAVVVIDLASIAARFPADAFADAAA